MSNFKASIVKPNPALSKVEPVVPAAVLAPEDQIKTLSVSYPEFCILLECLCRSIESNQSALSRYAQRAQFVPAPIAIVAELQSYGENLNRLYKRLIGGAE